MASKKTKTSSRAASTSSGTSASAGVKKKKTSSKAKVAASKTTARVSSAKNKATADKAAKSKSTPSKTSKTVAAAKKKSSKKTTAAAASKPTKKKKSIADKSAKNAAAGTTVKTKVKKPAAAAKDAPTTKKKKTSKKATTGKDASAVDPKADASTKKKTKKKKTSSRAGSKSGATSTKGYSVAEVASRAQADAQGYVFINGRRVRMISTKGVPVKKPVKSSAKDENDIETPKRPKIVKTHLSRKELNHYKALLIEKRHEIVGDLGAIEQEALRNLDGGTHMPIHMADVGTDTYDQDFLLGLAEAERKQLMEIDDALLRIQQNTYGVCVMTGNPIPEARLEAKPWAKHTIEAARQLEGNFGP